MNSTRLCFLVVLGFVFSFLHAQQLPTDLWKGQTFRSIGPGAMSGRVTAITVSPANQNIIFAGTASGGLWRSNSGGTVWEPIFDKAPTQSIGSVALNPKNPDEIWVGTGEGNPRNSQNFGKGIFKTIDGGKNWQFLGLAETRAIHRVIINPDNPDIVYAAAMGPTGGPGTERGVFKTTDGGKTWRKVLFVNDRTGCAELVADAKNPNKLIAAMWEFDRKPWFFKSGGKGSGIYVSFDGGETWKRRTEKDGLPEGELGRIGLAISVSNPNYVYALVEATENALYRSTDGGQKWQKMATKNIGDRPFYYSEIYVDPTDELRIYTIFTTINKSEDGGKTFETFVNWEIHPDHHAFWISPTNPDYLINGNDGGINITRDRGKTWHFAENLPVGQFYHINIDNDQPFNVYGGLQDNGSWVGPSAVWKAGGIRNADWREVLFGDGFDVVPNSKNNRYLWAAWQGGNISYVDKMTGESRSVKPVHPDEKVTLRYNWNAAMAADFSTDCGLFYGSQFVHRTRDCGETWEIISPDLTTNDTSKMHQSESGGLTYDATNAENHCTIISIAPSAKNSNIIWVGTDDGQLSKTEDGGKNWVNLTKNISNMPKNAWIPQIELSSKNEREAWVTVNNYRQNDWKPYLFYTNDGGKSWRNKANPAQISSYTLSFVQDPEVENLWFLGADDGLYFSFDAGENWQKWTVGDFPSVNIMDMKIQPRDGSLVLGTFGRAIWVLDDLRPLRELAKNTKITENSFKIFPPATAVQANFRSYDGPRFNAHDIFEGENFAPFGHLYFWVKPEKTSETVKKEEKKEEKKSEKGKSAEKEKAVIRIISEKNDTIRTLKWPLDTGLSRQTWYLDAKSPRMPSKDAPKPDAGESGGAELLPGTYKIIATYKKMSDSTLIRVLPDPRSTENLRQTEARVSAEKAYFKSVERASKANDRLLEMKKTLVFVEDSWKNVPDSLKNELVKEATALKDSIGAMQKMFYDTEEFKGIKRNENTINSKIWGVRERIGDAPGEPGENVRILIRQSENQIARAVEKVNLFIENDFKKWQEKAEKVPVDLFKEIKKVE